MPQKRQAYNISISVINNSQYIESNCSDISFINTGPEDCLVNNFLLVPGASIGFTAQFNEIDTTKYLINFPTNVTTGKQVNKGITVIRKIYV